MAEATEIWADIVSSVRGLNDGQADGIANMANIAALLFHSLPDVNWAGFYRAVDGADGPALLLGPFQGKVACVHIPFGQGVCGTAAAAEESQCVPDVHAFEGHIACDSASASELVVPVIRDGRVVAVIDLDSPVPARFGPADVAGAEALAALIADRI